MCSQVQYIMVYARHFVEGMSSVVQRLALLNSRHSLRRSVYREQAADGGAH
jgi:hypothetical protein